MTAPGEGPHDWTLYVAILEASPDLLTYILHHPHGTPWPDLEREQVLCRSILARRAAMEAL